MSELPIVLHVGAPKAGSSALQHDLTWNPLRPVRDRPGVACEYVAIDAAGNLLRGDALDGFATLFASRYCMSADAASLAALGDERLRALAGALSALREAGTIPVMSYELWLHADAASAARFAAALDAPLHVVAYVRDPVSWLRSLFWQRRGRRVKSRAEWMEEHLAECRWDGHLKRWRGLPGVVRLDVRLADRSVPHDFATLLGIDPPPTVVRHNATVPGEFARYLERHRVTPELSVSEAKFAWQRWTEAAGAADGFDPPPDPFDADDVRAVIDATSASSAALLDLCDDDVRSRIVADARWWSADPEVHAGSPCRRAPAAPIDEADRLLDAGLRALVAADSAWRAEERRRRLAERRLADAEGARAAAESALAAAAAALAAAPPREDRCDAVVPAPSRRGAALLRRFWPRSA